MRTEVQSKMADNLLLSVDRMGRTQRGSCVDIFSF